MLNLTPHPIVIMDHATGKTLTIPASGTIARVEQTYEDAGTVAIEGLPVPAVRTEFGEVTNIPDDDTPIIVSGMVLSALAGRPNTYAPDTNVGAVRNEKGHIQAVTRLIAA